MDTEEFTDHYDTLAIEFDATAAEIKAAYRKLAVQYHPDKHPQENELYKNKFQQITSAYQTLSDPYKKGMYDFQYRMIVLNEGPRYEYIEDSTPPDTTPYAHKYTRRSKRTLFVLSLIILSVLIFQLIRIAIA